VGRVHRNCFANDRTDPAQREQLHVRMVSCLLDLVADREESAFECGDSFLKRIALEEDLDTGLRLRAHSGTKPRRRRRRKPA
jgi:hypothetical protein